MANVETLHVAFHANQRAQPRPAFRQYALWQVTDARLALFEAVAAAHILHGTQLRCRMRGREFQQQLVELGVVALDLHQHVTAAFFEQSAVFF